MADPLLLKQWVSQIDSRTTYVCLHAAGDIEHVDDPFQTLAGPYLIPPCHIHCRSSVRPYMAGFVNEQRDLANAELQRRPEKYRDTRNTPIPPPPDDGGGSPALPEPAPPTPAPLEGDDAWNSVDDVDDATKDERAGAQAYLGSFEIMNTNLREQRDRDDISDRWLRRMDALTALINRSRLDEPIRVYRGLKSAGDLVDGSAEGLTLEDLGYMSTSTDRAFATSFTGAGSDRVLMVIDAPEGTPAIRPNQYADADHQDAYARESEILFGPGTDVRVTSDQYETIDGEEVRVWRATIV